MSGDSKNMFLHWGDALGDTELGSSLASQTDSFFVVEVQTKPCLGSLSGFVMRGYVFSVFGVVQLLLHRHKHILLAMCIIALVKMCFDCERLTVHCSCCFLWVVLAKAAKLSWLCDADVLLQLVQERGFEMFVHPIAPVLNETRHVVAPFNHKLQQQVHPPLLNADCETCQCPVLLLCQCSCLS